MAAPRGMSELLSPARRAMLFSVDRVHAYRLTSAIALVSVMGIVLGSVCNDIWPVIGFSWLLALSLYLLSDITRRNEVFVKNQPRLVSAGLYALTVAKIAPALRAAGMSILGFSSLTAANIMTGHSIIIISFTGLALLISGTTILALRMLTSTDAIHRD